MSGFWVMPSFFPMWVWCCFFSLFWSSFLFFVGQFGFLRKLMVLCFIMGLIILNRVGFTFRSLL